MDKNEQQQKLTNAAIPENIGSSKQNGSEDEAKIKLRINWEFDSAPKPGEKDPEEP